MAAGRSCTTPGSRSGGSAPCTRRTSALGEESPYADASQMARGGRADVEITPPTTFVDVGDFLAARRAGAAGAPDADRSREPLDAGARRPHAEHVPVGGVRAGPIARAPETDADGRRATCSQACVRRPTSARGRGGAGVSEFLDDEWLDGRGSAGAPRPGRRRRCRSWSPVPTSDGDGKWHLRLDDGVVAEVDAGHRHRARPHAHGRLPGGGGDGGGRSSTRASPSCRGGMKTAGDPGLVLDVLAAVGSRRRQAR